MQLSNLPELILIHKLARYCHYDNSFIKIGGGAAELLFSFQVSILL
jgi:hypothetical protein